MTEALIDAPKIITLFGTLFVCGSMVALGFVGVCKLLNWAPVNLTVTINDMRNTD